MRSHPHRPLPPSDTVNAAEVCVSAAGVQRGSVTTFFTGGQRISPTAVASSATVAPRMHGRIRESISAHDLLRQLLRTRGHDTAAELIAAEMGFVDMQVERRCGCHASGDVELQLLNSPPSDSANRRSPFSEFAFSITACVCRALTNESSISEPAAVGAAIFEHFACRCHRPLNPSLKLNLPALPLRWSQNGLRHVCSSPPSPDRSQPASLDNNRCPARLVWRLPDHKCLRRAQHRLMRRVQLTVAGA